MLWLRPKATVKALATEEAILRCRLENGSPDTLCFWQGKKCVVVGYDRNRDKVNFQLCEEWGVPICRRNSGGGAIYQDEGNLNYSLIAAQDGISLPSDVQRARHIIDSTVARAISNLGLKAYAMNGGGVSVGGGKVSGSAQFVLWGYLLHHGVVAVNTNLNVLRKLIPANKTTVTTLERELERKVDVKKLAALISAEFATAFDTRAYQGRLTDEEKRMAQKLLEEKYLLHDWNGCLHA